MLSWLRHILRGVFGRNSSPSQTRRGGKIKRWLFPLVALLMLSLVWVHSMPSELQAADAPVFLPGGGIFTKPVKSFKERRMTRVIPQTADYSCGAAAMATLLHYHFGHDIAEKEAILGMFEHGDQEGIRQRGFSMLDMKRFAQSRGLQVEGFQVSDVNTLKKLTVPVITLITAANYKHFVVIRKVDDRFAYLSDPSWGNRRIPLEDFGNVWSKVILVAVGPCLGTPEGLYSETESNLQPKGAIMRDYGQPGCRFALDPTFSIFNVSPRVSIGTLSGFATGLPVNVTGSP
jgi:predicted double-glycine peptidase